MGPVPAPPDRLTPEGLRGDAARRGVQVVRFDEADLGGPEGRRDPHRHDYHELVRVREGTGHHLVDGERVAVRPGSVAVIGRGQVHLFAEGRGLHGAAVRFGPELLGLHGTGGRSWLLAGRGGRVVDLPCAAGARFDAAIDALADETARPPDRHAHDVQQHLVAVLLHWIERAYDDQHHESGGAGDADVRLHRRFADVLERDFARHHDAAHYADALALPAAALSRALVGATGRTTKELVTDRVVTEAERLLRFSDLSVGEVAHRTGYADPLYFSRAFRRATGLAPTAYREAVRGGGGRGA